MEMLTGKRALIVGVASNRSIAWGIAEAMHREGAALAFSYQGERLQKRVQQLAKTVGSDIFFPCDVTSEEEIEKLFQKISGHWDGFDILVHSVAFAPREMLAGKYLATLNREGFLRAHEVSSYSFAALGKAARPMMKGRSASMLTLSYVGAVRVIPNYNIMGLAKASLEANMRYMAADLGDDGIRVNAISAGPIRTLAASGIQGFQSFLEQAKDMSPLRRNVTLEEVGNTAAFLCSDYASAITADIIYVDCGFHAVGIGEHRASSSGKK